MAKKKKKSSKFKIPVIMAIGILSLIVFYFSFGWLLFLRYMLGAIMFGTFTISLIALIQKKFGGKFIGF